MPMPMPMPIQAQSDPATFKTGGSSQLPAYRFNGAAQRYINATSGKFVPASAIRQAVDGVIEGAKGSIQDLASRLQAGEISLDKWQTGTAQAIKDLHVAAATAAKGGFAQMSQADYGYVGSLVKGQYQYLNEFAADIASGKQKTDGQSFINRAGMYADASRKTFAEVQGKANAGAGFDQERRVLEPGAEDCKDCKRLAARGWQPIGSLPELGDTQCLTNCKCNFEYRKSEMAEMSMSEEQTLQLATFDLNGDLEEINDYVIVRGKIFEAGSFEDKNFSISTEELAGAVEGFTPVPVDYSHTTGPLDGKLGELRSVSLSEDGKNLLGEVAIPKWLDKALGDTARKVSCTWNRATKRLEKLALVNTPRIQDAVLYSFFIADQEEKQGQEQSQDQDQEAEFEGKRNSATDHKTIQSIHDHCMSLGAKCSGENAEYSVDPINNKELPTMSTSEETNKPPVVDFKDSVEYQALQAQFNAQQTEIERMKAEKRHSEAVAAAEELIRLGKAVPAERDALVAAFEMAATDDAKNPVQVTFGEGEGKQGSRLDALKAIYACRPAHVLFGETVPVGGSILYSPSSAQTKKDGEIISQERIAELMGYTSLGMTLIEGGKN